MATAKKDLGVFSEKIIKSRRPCPKCRRSKKLVKLPTNFKCTDLICDFCDFLAKVKAVTVTDVKKLCQKVISAA